MKADTSSVVGVSKDTDGAGSRRVLSVEGEGDAGWDFLPVNASQTPIFDDATAVEDLLYCFARLVDGSKRVAGDVAGQLLLGWPQRRSRSRVWRTTAAPPQPLHVQNPFSKELDITFCWTLVMADNIIIVQDGGLFSEAQLRGMSQDIKFFVPSKPDEGEIK